MWPILIVASVMGGMRSAFAASEAIEAEVSLKVWDVLHGTLRWASEADGPCEAGLCDPRGHRGRGITEGRNVLHPRAVGEGGRGAQRAKRAYRRRPRSSCRRQRIASLKILVEFKFQNHFIKFPLPFKS